MIFKYHYSTYYKMRKKIKLYDTRFKKDAATYWSDVDTMKNAHNCKIIVDKRKIEYISKNIEKLGFDPEVFAEFKKNFFDEDLSGDVLSMHFKIIITSKGISHGDPVKGIYSCNHDIIDFLLSDRYSKIILTKDFSRNRDILQNMYDAGYKIIPFKSFCYVQTKNELAFEYEDYLFKTISPTPKHTLLQNYFFIIEINTYYGHVL